MFFGCLHVVWFVMGLVWGWLTRDLFGCCLLDWCLFVTLCGCFCLSLLFLWAWWLWILILKVVWVIVLAYCFNLVFIVCWIKLFIAWLCCCLDLCFGGYLGYLFVCVRVILLDLVLCFLFVVCFTVRVTGYCLCVTLFSDVGVGCYYFLLLRLICVLMMILLTVSCWWFSLLVCFVWLFDVSSWLVELVRFVF